MQSQTEHNRINETIETALKNLSNIIDVNTVVGTPVRTEFNDYIIPVSKVTVAVLAGGGEYGKTGIFKKSGDLPFSAGNGAIVSVKPCAFLIKENDKYKVLNVAETAYEKLLDKATDYISEFKNNDEKE